LRGTIESLLSRLEPSWKCDVVPSPRAGLSSSGRIEWNGNTIGWIGLVNKAVIGKVGLREAPAAGELQLAPLLAGARHVPQLRPLPRFPAVSRDLSLDLAEKTRFAELKNVVLRLNLMHLEDIQYVTTYRGKQLEKGRKSVTISLSFRSPNGTLTGGEIDAAIKRVVDAAGHALAATVRM
jgi:phenylalanyl-tRNA synthetase beta chain